MLRNLLISAVLSLLLAHAATQTASNAPAGPTVQAVGSIGQTRIYNVVRLQIPGRSAVLKSASYQDTTKPGDAFLSSSFILSITSPSMGVHVATLRGSTIWHKQWATWTYVLTDDENDNGTGDRVSLTIKRGTTTLLNMSGPSDQGKFGVLVAPAAP
jgi:hypothetical protein